MRVDLCPQSSLIFLLLFRMQKYSQYKVDFLWYAIFAHLGILDSRRVVAIKVNFGVQFRFKLTNWYASATKLWLSFYLPNYNKYIFYMNGVFYLSNYNDIFPTYNNQSSLKAIISYLQWLTCGDSFYHIIYKYYCYLICSTLFLLQRWYF